MIKKDSLDGKSDVAKPDANSKPADTKKAPAKDDTKSDAKAKSTVNNN